MFVELATNPESPLFCGQIKCKISTLTTAYKYTETQTVNAYMDL